MDGPTTTTKSASPARFVQRHLLWLLFACYALATLWPNAGAAMHAWRWQFAVADNGHVTFQLLLLSWMLFCAAVTTDASQIRSVTAHPLLLCLALVAVWAGPALLAVVAAWLVPQLTSDPAAAGILVGVALVATMPVANSSVGWVQNARGNLALALGLVVISISISPWITPQLLGVLGKSFSPSVQAECERLINHYSGWFFVVWVILPTAIGFICRLLCTTRRVEAVAGWLTISSAAALLALNYISSSLALPKAIHSHAPLVAIAAALAVGLAAVGVALGWTISAALRLPTETRSSLVFGLSMKHTGLALILTEAVLGEKQMAVLLIVLATLVQHLLAGVVQWLQVRRQPTTPS